MARATHSPLSPAGKVAIPTKMYIVVFTTEVDWKDSKKALVFPRERQANSPQQKPAASFEEGPAAFPPYGHLEGNRLHVSIFLVLLKITSGTLPYMNMGQSIRRLLLPVGTECYC